MHKCIHNLYKYTYVCTMHTACIQMCMHIYIYIHTLTHIVPNCNTQTHLHYNHKALYTCTHRHMVGCDSRKQEVTARNRKWRQETGMEGRKWAHWQSCLLMPKCNRTSWWLLRSMMLPTLTVLAGTGKFPSFKRTWLCTFQEYNSYACPSFCSRA